jgi:hypothetical protein
MNPAAAPTSQARRRGMRLKGFGACAWRRRMAVYRTISPWQTARKMVGRGRPVAIPAGRPLTLSDAGPVAMHDTAPERVRAGHDPGLADLAAELGSSLPPSPASPAALVAAGDRAFGAPSTLAATSAPTASARRVLGHRRVRDRSQR